MSIIFDNPDKSLYIGLSLKKSKLISLIQYPYVNFSDLFVVIPEGSSFIVHDYKRYIPRNIDIPNGINVTYVTESFFIQSGYNRNHHLHVVDDILFIILFDI